MIENEDLKERIEAVINECEDIISTLDSELKSTSTVTFRQIKEIENSIERLKKQGLTVPDELKELKLKLISQFDTAKRFSELKALFFDGILKIISHESTLKINTFQKDKKKIPSGIKPVLAHERPLGSKGNSNLEDYLIPVIKLMNNGLDYKEAFHKIKDVLDVRYNTVSSQCTRGIGLTTDEFVSYVQSGEITNYLKIKFADKADWIKSKLMKS